MNIHPNNSNFNAFLSGSSDGLLRFWENDDGKSINCHEY